MIMETYERKYKEALERAKTMIDDLRKGEDILSVSNLEAMFPELSESEDECVEKIKKDIISYLNNRKITSIAESNATERWLSWIEKYKPISFTSLEDTKVKMSLMKYISELNQDVVHLHPGIETCNEWIAWLEKQGEQKDSLSAQEAMDIAVAKCFEQGEQKPTDMVEPKFKVGDWVILTAGELSITLQIVNVDINKKRYWFNDSSYLPIVDEECLHLWTIKDAKDGDVLACGDKVTDCPFIFHNLTEELNPRSYCGVNTLHHFQDNDENGGFWCYSDEVRPATKKQRDLLFQKMKEAGYEWDSEKKELKKIEQKSTDEDMKTLLRTKYEKGRADAIAKIQNPAWSEEDDAMLDTMEGWLDTLCEYLKDSSSEYIPNVESCINWLKSLKNRKI